MKKNLLPFLALFYLSILSSCQKDNATNMVGIDAELMTTLESVSEDGTLDFFTMPASHELEKIPQDPNNPLTSAKVKLGQLLYHETALGVIPMNAVGMQTYSCASCHAASAGFQAGVPQGIGEGGEGFGYKGESRRKLDSYEIAQIDVQPIRTPTAMNGAYQEVMLWNGQFGATGINADTKRNWTLGTPIANNLLGYQGLETQAIAGLTVHRLECTEEGMQEMGYMKYFDDAFPMIPLNRRYTNEMAGLAIAAYERTLLANQAPFQQWLKGDHTAMTEEEKRGALLFFGKAECGNCHTGPALNTMEFHAYGMKDLFQSEHLTFRTSADNTENLGRAGFTKNVQDRYKFKVPQLYNLTDSPFYGHGSSFSSVGEVVQYKNAGTPENERVAAEQLSPSFRPLGLAEEEISAITAFLESALYDPNLQRYEPEDVLSGNCFPNSDRQSSIDLGCN